jgi:hypothetical protein
MAYGKGSHGKPPGCPAGAPDFARATGKPNDRQLASSQPRPSVGGQVKMPANQGGKSGKD